MREGLKDELETGPMERSDVEDSATLSDATGEALRLKAAERRRLTDSSVAVRLGNLNEC